MKTSIHTVCQFTGVRPIPEMLRSENSFHSEDWSAHVWSGCIDAVNMPAGSTIGVDIWQNAVLALSTITLRHTP